MLSVLNNRTYRHLFTAQVIALVGTGLMTVALGLLAYELAGADAGAVLGTALAIKMLAYAGVAPVAQAFADRLPRRSLLVALDLVRAAVALCLPFVTEVCRAPFGSRQAQRGRQLDPHPAQQQGQRSNPCRHVPGRPCQGAVERTKAQPVRSPVQQGFRRKHGGHYRHRMPQHQPRKPITQSHLNPPPRLHRATVAAMYRRTTGHSGPHAGAGIRYQ